MVVRPPCRQAPRTLARSTHSHRPISICSSHPPSIPSTTVAPPAPTLELLLLLVGPVQQAVGAVGRQGGQVGCEGRGGAGCHLSHEGQGGGQEWGQARVVGAEEANRLGERLGRPDLGQGRRESGVGGGFRGGGLGLPRGMWDGGGHRAACVLAPWVRWCDVRCTGGHE